MNSLSLPAFAYKVKRQKDTIFIFDVIRKKYVVLTPEEWVRQHVIHYLIEQRNYPSVSVAVEREIDLYGLRRRFDLVCYNRQGTPFLIVECKAPSVALSQKVFDQVFGYNLSLAAPYVAITNGITHYCGCWDANRRFTFLPDFPCFSEPEKN